MLTSNEPLVFSRLYLPRPIDAKLVETVLLRLAADQAAPTVVLEARAEASGLRHLLGVAPNHVRWLHRTLYDLLTGIEIVGLSERDPRLPVRHAVRLRLRPASLALADDRAQAVSTALLSSLSARLGSGETLVVQVLLGRRIAPQHVAADHPNPTQPWWQLLTQGQLPTPKPVRDQIQARSGQHGFAATIRVGVTATTPERQQQLIAGVLGALSTVRSRGVYLDLATDRQTNLDSGTPPWRWPLHLGVSEVVGLLAWPLGDKDLPGLPPLHPKVLRVPEAISTSERVFAVATTPGRARPVGITAADALGHMIALGPTGVGKSTALSHLIKGDIDAGRPVLVIDAKQQLVDDVTDRAVPADRIDDVVILDPADERAVGFNPLDVGDRDPDVVVDGLVAVMAAVFREGWGPRTQDIIHSCLLTLARVGHDPTGNRDPFTLLDLPRLLTDERFRTKVTGHVADDPGLGSFWAWYNGLAPGGQAHAIAAPLNKIRQYLLRPSLRRILGQPRPAFRLRDLFRDNKIVLVPLNEGLIGPLTAQLLGSLIVAETWSATLERAAEPNPTARPGMVYVDEVQKFLHLPTSIGDALAQSRSLGVAWHLAHQFRSQLSPDMRAAVDSNAKSKLIFKLSDPDDARDMARQAPTLEPVDFLSLDTHHAYANLTTGGTPAGWCSVRTLPPPPLTGYGDRIRLASRSTYGRNVTVTPTPNDTDAQPPVGRKRRTP